MPGQIVVLAGVNGAGKSSVLGQAIRDAGDEYFNPDEAAKQILESHAGMSAEAANGQAWGIGRDELERAIREDENFTFETTLGGNTIALLLQKAIDSGMEVSMRFMGLDSPERHIARVAARVQAGGHDIPEAKIRERFRTSVQNLIRLMPGLTELVVYDNSFESTASYDNPPRPVAVMKAKGGHLTAMTTTIPEWAATIVAAAQNAKPAERRKKQ